MCAGVNPKLIHVNEGHPRYRLTESDQQLYVTTKVESCIYMERAQDVNVIVFKQIWYGSNEAKFAINCGGWIYSILIAYIYTTSQYDIIGLFTH